MNPKNSNTKNNVMETKKSNFLRTLTGRIALSMALITWFVLQATAQPVVLTNPSSPWIVPSGATSIKVEVWGGGGAGGGCNRTWSATYGSGGGGGAYNISTFTVSAGQSYDITIGAGGTGNSDANGSNGTASSVSGPGGTINANPGTGGARRGGTAGTGGSGFNTGGGGGTGTGYGAGGGGGAGNAAPTHTGNGGSGSNSTAGAVGGGTIPGGIGGTPQTGNGNGNDGDAPGGGGGGGRQSNNNGSKSGGDGDAGQVVITYTPCTTALISAQPESLAVCEGEAVSFSVIANGEGLSYQWYKGTSEIDGANSNIYAIPFAAPDDEAGYKVEITNDCGSVLASENATLTLNDTPAAIVVDIQDVSCPDANDGEITIAGSSGTEPYDFSTDNGENWISSEDNPFTIDGLKADEPYEIRVRDYNGCESMLIP